MAADLTPFTAVGLLDAAVRRGPPRRGGSAPTLNTAQWSGAPSDEVCDRDRGPRTCARIWASPPSRERLTQPTWRIGSRSGINVWSQSVSRTAMRRRCVRKTAVGEEKQDLSRSQISRRRLTMTSRLWPSVGVMTARARPPNRRTAGAPRTAMRRRFSRMCRCSAARRPLGVVCCRRL